MTITNHAKEVKAKIETSSKLISIMAKYACTDKEIAYELGVSEGALSRNKISRDLLARGRQQLKSGLKRCMFRKAYNGDTKMMIWLSQQHLGYSRQSKVEQTNIAPLFADPEELADEVPVSDAK